MPRAEAQYATGSYLADLRAKWAPLYKQRIDMLGATTTICPAGDPYYGKLDATTCTNQYGASGIAVTWTLGPGPTALGSLATPFKIPDEIQGLVPAITQNGTSEFLGRSTSDNAYWTRIAGAFSIIVYVKVTDTAAIRRIATKADGGGGREWDLIVNASDALEMRFWDDSAAVYSKRVSDAAITMGTWVQLAMTHNGNNGATIAAGAILYQNGASIASTATEDAGFVAMEDLGAEVNLGRLPVGGSEGWFASQWAGGPLGFTFVQTALTADTIRQDYDLCRAFLPY